MKPGGTKDRQHRKDLDAVREHSQNVSALYQNQEREPMTTPTRAGLKAWSRDNAKLALAVCEAQAYAEIMKEKVAAYTQPIFESFNFIYEGNSIAALDERKGEKLAGQPIPSPDADWFCMLHGKDESPELQAKLRSYYDALHAEHVRQGYRDLEPDHCPALEAATLHTQAENALLDSGMAMLGQDRSSLFGEMRERALKLFTGAALEGLSEMQEECGRETGHKNTEPSVLDPHRLRCANCCKDLQRKAA